MISKLLYFKSTSSLKNNFHWHYSSEITKLEIYIFHFCICYSNIKRLVLRYTLGMIVSHKNLDFFLIHKEFQNFYIQISSTVIMSIL